MENITINTNIRVYSLEESPSELKKLVEAAKVATETAYAPYSHFQVGAAILLANGQIMTGSNQENAAYPSGLCAERTTIFYTNAHYPNEPIEAIAVAAFNGKDFTEEPCSPCGSCRQVILEYENKHKKPIKILLYGKKAIYEFASIKDLLPFSFGEDELKGK